MKRRLIKSLVLLACMVSALLLLTGSASASGYFTYGDYYVYRDSNNKLTIDEYLGYASNLTIPSSIQGYPVVAIDGFAFQDCGTLTSVTIPSSVKTIGYYAFDNCSSLSTVILPAGLTTISSSTFSDCISLTNITIPSTVVSIGDWAFYKCTSLSSIQLPGGLKSIGQYAFNSCSSLSNIGIPNGVTSIGASAFAYCDSLTSIVVPNSVLSIGEHGFAYCDTLSSVSLSNSMTTISDSLFISDYDLTSILIPGSVKTIASNAFSFIDFLSIGIPPNVTSIASNAFAYCDYLTIVGIFGSYAQTYANNYGIYFLGVYPLPKVTNVAVDKTLVPVGETVYCSIGATGGKPPLAYGIDIYKGETKIYEGPWGDTTSFSYTFTETGTYTIVGFVSDGDDEQDNLASDDIVVYVPLSITSITADKSNSDTGKPITWTASATNGSGAKTYLFRLFKDNVQLVSGTWGTSRTYSYTPTAAGTYSVVCYVKDSTGTLSKKSSDVIVKVPLSITSVKADKTSANVGTAITWTTAAAGGSGAKTYLFKLYKDGVQLVSGNYGTANTYKYTPTAAGTYNVLGYVKDSTGTVSLKSANVIVKVPLSITGINADKTSAATGTAITWTTTAAGGEGTKTYLFKLYKDGAQLVSGSYSTAKTFKYTLKAAGTYSVQGYVKDSTGTVSKKSTDVIIYVPLSITSVKANKTSGYTGTAITWSTAAAGGYGIKSYLFNLYKNGVQLVSGNYGTANTYKYTPTAAGTYSVLCYVKDSTGSKSMKSTDIIIKVPLTITSMNADKTSSVTGSAITWTAKATGGSGTKTYQFKLYKGTQLLSTRNYSTASTFKYTPTSNGTYSVVGYVKDSTGTVSMKSADVIVAPLSITSVKADKTSPVTGMAITWTTTAIGGNGAKTYLFKLYKGTQQLFSGSYGTAATYRYTPTAAGTYNVVGYAKDSSGTVVSMKSANVIVNLPLSITSVISNKTSAVIGTAITWTAKATGGGGTKTYLFKLYKGSQLLFTGTYGSAGTYSYTPASPGTYNVVGYVKDSNGTVVSMKSANVLVYAPLSITSVTADQTSAGAGTKVTWTTIAAGGNGTKTYLFKLYKGSDLLFTGTYGTAGTYSYTPTEAGTYSVMGFVKDSTGTVSKMSTDVTVNAVLSITSVTADKASAQVGTEITWTTTATSGSGTMSYLFELYKGDELLDGGTYGAAGTFSYTPAEAGTYSVKGFVKDSADTLSMKGDDVTVYDPLSITSVTADKTSADAGMEITWTTAAIGGSGTKSYLFELYKGDELLDAGSYGSSESFSYTPSEAGTYSVMGFVKDSTGTFSMKSGDVTVNAPLSITSVNANKTSAQAGTEITWTISATGGSGTKSYLFELYKGEDLLDGGAYGAAETFSYIPAEAGTYSVMGFVKDSTGTVSMKSGDVTVYEPLSITSVHADKTSSIIGSAITWTTAAEGGSGTKSYLFELYKGGELLDGGSYGAAETYSYTPNEAGTYSVTAFVKDSTGTVSVRGDDVVAYTPLSITSVTADRTSAQSGTAITWTAAATGGSGTKSYLFELYKGENLLDGGSYGSADTFSYTPAEAGTYSVKGFVKDSLVTVSVKGDDVTVYNPLSITSVTADKTNADAGTEITWTTAAAGGSGTKSYLFELYKDDVLLDDELYDGGSYGASDTFRFTPTEAGTYKVCGYVKDSTGTQSLMSGDVTVIVP